MKRPLGAALFVLLLLSGCDLVVLSPSGYIAAQQSDLLVSSTLLMLIIIIPVLGLITFFAWRYHEGRRSRYDPDWHHSTSLELVIWATPLMIVICLGAITWVGTHKLDPFRPLENIADRVPVPEDVEPMEVQVVALDWKWLFIYPEYGIASVNQMAAPVNRPIRFHLTSENYMNAFFVPALAGMIYAMPGMQSQLNAVMNYEGEYQGLSANYSGAGFSGMRFRFLGLDEEGFDAWVETTRAAEGTLDRAQYLDLAVPSMNVPPMFFGDIEPGIFRLIVNRCVEDGKMCMDEMMALDAEGGTGYAGTLNVRPASDRQASALGAAPTYPVTMCTVADSVAQYGPDTLVLLDQLPTGAGATAQPDDSNL
jgi:cytochrome o ubiquinol oxidase subunit 2